MLSNEYCFLVNWDGLDLLGRKLIYKLEVNSLVKAAC